MRTDASSEIVTHGWSVSDTIFSPGPKPYLYPKGTDVLPSIRHLLKNEFLYLLSSYPHLTRYYRYCTLSLHLALNLSLRMQIDDGFAQYQNHIPCYLKIKQL